MTYKNKLKPIILLLFIGFFAFPVSSLDAQSKDTNIRHSKAKFLGKSSPMTSWKFSDVDYTKTYENKKQWKSAIKGIHDFRNAKNFPRNFADDILPKKGDPITQSLIQKTNVDEITILQDYDGIDDDQANISVPDCNGDIGLDYYVMTANGSGGSIIHVYDKITGDLVENTTMNPLWEELGANGVGDPVLFFDRFEERWVLTEFTFNNSMLVAVSESSNPMGSYFVYEFVAPSFPDYPKYGNWPDAWFITTNEYLGYNPTYALDKAAMIAGDPDVTFIEFDQVAKFGDGDFFQLSSPIDFSGKILPGANTEFMSIRIYDDEWPGEGGDRIEYYEFVPDFADPGNSTANGPFELITAPFESNLCNFSLFDCIEQSDGTLISAIHTVIMNKVQYRNFGEYESILLNFSVDLTGDNNAGVRWMELRRTEDTEWSIYQESTWAPDDGTSRFMGTMTQDSKGNILLAYAMVGPNVDPSVGVTGRRVSDPPGIMSFSEKIIVEGQQPAIAGFQGGGFRWGDYFSVTVDPQDDQTFWLTSEYMPIDRNWSTRLTSMNIRRDSIDAQVSLLNNPVTSDALTAAEAVTITITNPGYKAIFDVPFGVMLDGQIVEEGIVEGILEPLASTEITLSTTVDLSDFGIYEFKAYTYLEGDENIDNDTLRSTVTHLASYDLEALVADNAAFSCEELTDVNASFRNNGLQVIESFDAQLYIDGMLEQTVNVVTNLVMGNTEEVVFTDVSLADGVNLLTYKAVNINEESDQIPSNDEFEFEMDKLIDANFANLVFETDFFSTETSWNITDDQGMIVYEGGGYTGGIVTVNTNLCFLEGCYTFNLFDAFGNGWNSSNTAFLEIIDENGVKVVVLDNPNFGTFWSAEFCLPFVCDIDAEVEYEDVSAPGVADASIYINFPAGNEDTQYSINNGATYQSSPLFTNLVQGEYEIVIVDQFGCVYEETINVLVDLEDFESSLVFQVNPNPSFGMLQVLLQGYDGPQEIQLTITNELGQKVAQRRIRKYSDGYRATLLVPELPAGLYFISAQTKDVSVLKKFIKQ